MKQKGVLILAIVLAVAAVVLMNLYVGKIKETTIGGLEEVHIVFAAKDIQPNTRLDASMVKADTLPKKYFTSQHVTQKDMDLIIGQMVQHEIKKGQPILWLNLFSQAGGGKYFAQSIDKGSRAFAISTDDIGGVAGHLRPDDRVDVLGTFETPSEMKIGLENIKDDPQAAAMAVLGAGGKLEVKKATLTLLQNIKILDVGNTAGMNPAVGSAMRAGMGGDMGGLAASRGQAMNAALGGGSYSTVTLLLTPIEAELMAFAADKGRIALALRNPDDLEMIPSESLPTISFTDILQPKIREESVKRRATQAARPSGPELLTPSDTRRR